jgi:hypothetical protein
MRHCLVWIDRSNNLERLSNKRMKLTRRRWSWGEAW